jgi:hypothetical protein
VANSVSALLRRQVAHQGAGDRRLAMEERALNQQVCVKCKVIHIVEIRAQSRDREGAEPPRLQDSH